MVNSHGDSLSKDLLRDVKKVHIVGIGGISMSAIAKILVERGFVCTGSDKVFNDNCADVEAIGVRVFIGHEASNISDQNLLIYTAAVNETIPEIVRAKELGIPVVGRAKFLGELMEEYENSIAVSGAHGKTSTTSMIAHILHDVLDPTVLVGGLLHDNHSNVMIGDSATFVHEACEFKDTFLSLKPRYSVILNIDADHLDYFSGLEAIEASFRKFAYATKDLVFYNIDDPSARRAVQGIPHKYAGAENQADGKVASSRVLGCESGENPGTRLVSFGQREDADYRVVNLQRGPGATAQFAIEKDGEILAEISLSVPGFVYWSNAAAAFACCFENLMESEEAHRRDKAEIASLIARRLGDFANAGRRFEVYGTFEGITVVDDFAHHPNEIKPALETAMAVSHGRVIALFQPYTYSRTKELLEDFGRCFVGIDELVVSDILGGREVDPGDIHARDVVRVTAQNGVKSHLSDTLENAGDLAISLAREGDMIITLGCGNVYLAARYMEKKLRNIGTI
ncbi:MAG: UDP-N-acetylmuramate--L-alanine ligase [Bacillota bacterium]|nr:UDP-N-acetylmuramate--L-alanine ligase [Bacillota bacterium]